MPAVSKNLFAGKYKCEGVMDPEIKVEHEKMYAEAPDGYADFPGVSFDRPESITEYKQMLEHSSEEWFGKNPVYKEV